MVNALVRKNALIHIEGKEKFRLLPKKKKKIKRKITLIEVLKNDVSINFH